MLLRNDLVNDFEKFVKPKTTFKIELQSHKLMMNWAHMIVIKNQTAEKALQSLPNSNLFPEFAMIT